MSGRILVIAMGLLVVACGNTGSGTSIAPIATVDPSTQGATAQPETPQPLPSTAASSLPAACFPLPHDAPDLEALLPTRIAGRTLSSESYHGRLMVACVQGGSEADVAEFASTLATEGLGLDDVSLAVAGRSDTTNDPPYFILAYRLTGTPGTEWPVTIGIDNPDAAAFQPTDIAGKHVLVGETAGMEQSEHARGRPYVWNSASVHYLVVTDDPAWAAEALSAIH